MHENSRFHFLNGTKKLSVFLLSQQNNPRHRRSDNNDQPDKAAESQEGGTDMAQPTLMALSCPFRLYGLHRCVFRLLHIICLCHTALRLLYAVCAALPSDCCMLSVAYLRAVVFHYQHHPAYPYPTHLWLGISFPYICVNSFFP